MIEELFEAIQAFLRDNRETRDEEQEQLLEAFYETPSYVERFKRNNLQEKERKENT